jgi:hypothetical protein
MEERQIKSERGRGFPSPQVRSFRKHPWFLIGQWVLYFSAATNLNLLLRPVGVPTIVDPDRAAITVTLSDAVNGFPS